MKKFGKYLRNPAFALTTVNPARGKKRRKKSRRNTGVRKVRVKRNRPARKRRAKRKNPIEVRHIIEEVPARNPARKKHRKKTRQKNPHTPMSKHRKRRKSRRNPASRKRRSPRARRRNPSRRRSRRGLMRRLKNPAVISDVIDKTNIKRGIGILAGIGGTRWIVNKLIQGDPVTGVRMFDLPGLTYSTAVAPLTQAQFTAMNKTALAFYETVIPAVAGWLVRRYDVAISEGLLGSAVANLGIAMLRTTQIGQQAGLNAFLPRQRGIGTYIPGVPAILSGPGTQFINNGAPVPAGLRAAVTPAWHRQTVMSGANPFPN